MPRRRSTPSKLHQPVAGRRHRGAPPDRAARQRHRAAQSDRLDLMAPRCPPTAARRSNRSSRTSSTAQGRENNLDCLPKSHGAGSRTPRRSCWRLATARPASSRCGRRNSTPTTIADLPRRNPQAQCRPWHQRPAAGRRRAQRDQHGDLDGADADHVGDPGHDRARRADPDRLGAVRLALCRPQHPAADRRPAAVDADAVGRRSRHRDRSRQPPRRDRGDGGIARSVPRHHDPGPRAERGAGQGPRRQGGADRADRGENRRVRGHRPPGAGEALQTSTDSMQQTAHAWRPPPSSRARWSPRSPRRPRKPRSTSRRWRPAPNSSPPRSPRSAVRSPPRRRSQPRRCRRPAKPTLRCRASPTTPSRSAR